jgi:hypothetical protein
MVNKVPVDDRTGQAATANTAVGYDPYDLLAEMRLRLASQGVTGSPTVDAQAAVRACADLLVALGIRPESATPLVARRLATLGGAR